MYVEGSCGVSDAVIVETFSKNEENCRQSSLYSDLECSLAPPEYRTEALQLETTQGYGTNFSDCSG